MNLIDKDELIEDLKTEFNNLKMNGLKGTPRIKELSFREIVERIDEQPIIEERKHGHWIEDEFTEDDDEWLSRWRCSVCNCSMSTLKGEYPTWKACPNCTAIMDKDEVY